MQLALTEERTLILQTARQFGDHELAANAEALATLANTRWNTWREMYASHQFARAQARSSV